MNISNAGIGSLIPKAFNVLSRSLSIKHLQKVKTAPQTQKFGQPTHGTHPHIIGKDEVNHGISRSEFRQRREKLQECLLSSWHQSSRKNKNEESRNLLILPSAKRQFMVDKIPYPFRQDTDFRYLTGCLQYDTVLVMEFSSTSSKSVLFCKEGNAFDEKWEGARIGFGEAVSFLGVDEASPLSSLEGYLEQFIRTNGNVNIWYEYLEPRNPDIHKVMHNFLQERRSFGNIDSPRSAIHKLRCTKSPSEISLMRKACQVGAESLKRTMAASRHLETEAELLATVDYHSKMQGACQSGYPTVAASGESACTIHYTAGRAVLKKEDMVLMDAGCEFHGYTSDITRTWPPGGHYSQPQTCVYEAVLDTQTRLIAGIQPGVSTIDGLYKSMMEILGNNLKSLGLLSTDEKSSYLQTHEFCPHHVSHYLGMDVHDTALVSKTTPLVPGMVITLEPGCYIPSSRSQVDPVYHGIGVRIEDDILITETGVEVLSAGCPSSIQDILAVVNS